MRMRTFLLLVPLLIFGVSVDLMGQGRPRRVGDQSRSTQTQSPSQPPVLGGSNYPGGRQPSSPSSQPVSNNGPEEVDAGDVIKVNTTLVTIPVSVMDRDGRYIPNLQKADFRIWEDGVEQQVAFFASVDKPFSVVLMLDTSPSTQFRLEDIQDAAISFVNQLRPDDKVMVVSFNNDIKVLTDLTTDRIKLQRAIRRAETGDGTRLYDAVDMVINERLNRIQGRKAIVLFTDGVDTTSRRSSYQANITDAEELDALIYTVQYDTSGDVSIIGPGPGYPGGQVDIFGTILGGIFGGGTRGGRRGGRGGYPQPGRGTHRSDYEFASEYLQELADRSGGRRYQADSIQNMSYAFANVAEELRRQYTIGYYPKRSPQAGQRRQIKVRANDPNLAVKARDSYIFNPSGTAVVDDSARSNGPVLKKVF